MIIARYCMALCMAALLAGCSFENRYEREADKITRAVMNNDLRPVQNDLAPRVTITRIEVAKDADELDALGKLRSVKERAADAQPPCKPGWHCFDVTFEKGNYLESLRMDENGKVTDWNFHRAPKGAA